MDDNIKKMMEKMKGKGINTEAGVTVTYRAVKDDFVEKLREGFDIMPDHEMIFDNLESGRYEPQRSQWEIKRHIIYRGKDEIVVVEVIPNTVREDRWKLGYTLLFRLVLVLKKEHIEAMAKSFVT
ncbi:MAG: hypothetical protein ACFFDT_28800 [Candidatus Hodarchaeota archaeon]